MIHLPLPVTEQWGDYDTILDGTERRFVCSEANRTKLQMQLHAAAQYRGIKAETTYFNGTILVRAKRESQ